MITSETHTGPNSGDAVPREFLGRVADVLRLQNPSSEDVARISPPLFAAIAGLGDKPGFLEGVKSYGTLLPEIRIVVSLEAFSEIFAQTVAAKSEVEVAAKAREELLKAMKSEIAKADALYVNKSAEACLDFCNEIEHKYADSNFSEQVEKLHALRAWCRYRQGNYEAALESIQRAQGDLRALECELYIRSYAEGYKDPARVEVLEAKVGDTITGANAAIIRARLAPEGVDVPYDRVREYASHYEHRVATNPLDTDLANLMHNTGRVFLDRARVDGAGSKAADLWLALGYFEKAERAYGTEGNFHHRAALHHWAKVAFDALGDKTQAATSAIKSQMLWIEQLKIDSSNPVNFQKGMESFSKARVAVEASGVQRSVYDTKLADWTTGIFTAVSAE